jgi:L-arabinose isomerase
MLSLTINGAGRFKFVVGEGQSVHGPIPPTGNTNTRGFFQPDVRAFLQRWVAEGPTHHFALGVGHHAQSLRRIADILDIECAVVTSEA